MSYLSEMRKKVGHDLIITTGATVLVFNDKNEILLNLRSDTNNWGIPGGGKELHETLEECAIRELKEETNLTADSLELVTVLSGDDCYFKYPNGDEVESVSGLFKVKSYSGELYINDTESTKLQFFSLDNLPELEKRTKIIIDKIKNKEIIL